MGGLIHLLCLGSLRHFIVTTIITFQVIFAQAKNHSESPKMHSQAEPLMISDSPSDTLKARARPLTAASLRLRLKKDTTLVYSERESFNKTCICCRRRMSMSIAISHSTSAFPDLLLYPVTSRQDHSLICNGQVSGHLLSPPFISSLTSTSLTVCQYKLPA